MTEYASFEDLTSGFEVSKEVILTSGSKVRVRGLSRYEYMLAGKTANANGESVDPAVFEALIVHFGMVEPKLSRGQVEAWQKSPGGNVDFHRVDREIMDLSGFGEGADKSGLREVRDES